MPNLWDMTLSSASTDQEVWDEYDDCSSYEELADRSKCLRFITACRIILRRRPMRAKQKDREYEFDTISKEMESARRWLSANPATSATGSGKTRFADFSNFRD